jgi:hypothetical protein
VTFLLLGALVAVNAAYVWHLERKDRRHDDQVSRLLQRIQAPEQAVIEHSQSERLDGDLYSNEFREDDELLEQILREHNGDS